MDGKKFLISKLTSVRSFSYTHLDVYKRQICTLLCVMLKHPRRIIVCEKSPERIRLVREHYPDVQVVKPEDCREIVLRSSDHGGADVVLEVAGTDDTFRLAWELSLIHILLEFE